MITLNNSVSGEGLENIRKLDFKIWGISSNAFVNSPADDLNDEIFNETYDTVLRPLEDIVKYSVHDLLMRFSECYLHGYFDDRFDDHFK